WPRGSGRGGGGVLERGGGHPLPGGMAEAQPEGAEGGARPVPGALLPHADSRGGGGDAQCGEPLPPVPGREGSGRAHRPRGLGPIRPGLFPLALAQGGGPGPLDFRSRRKRNASVAVSPHNGVPPVFECLPVKDHVLSSA
ncbi:MAG: hypothetical protein DRJ64_03620, partial [Thermoprotei archaeon]